jgi:uncharacterized cysteine cluster protein YcgN (CxxCxxCC family)
MTRKNALQQKLNQQRFWERKKLSQMSPQEWESLCDHCGRCCLLKVQTTEGRIHFTSVGCSLLDEKTGTCSNYRGRTTRMRDCMRLTWRNAGRIRYLPPTCAYRLLAEGKPLPTWHPLVTGRRESVREAGISVAGRFINEGEGIEPDDYRITWIPAVPKKRPTR